MGFKPFEKKVWLSTPTMHGASTSSRVATAHATAAASPGTLFAPSKGSPRLRLDKVENQRRFCWIR